ncbi:VanW family protein [Saccharomonospora sp. NPDC006951]
MREEHDWPDGESEPTDHTSSPTAFSAYPQRYPADDLAGELLESEPMPVRSATSRRFRKGIGTAFLLAGAAVVVFVVLYAADLMFSIGDVPRGVTVAGVDVGGMSRLAAEATLKEELGPRLSRPVAVKAGDVTAELSPREAGLGLDWQRTVEQAGSQPLNPLTRIASFFTTREVGVVSTSDDHALRAEITRIAGERVNRDVVEGDIRFRGVSGVPNGVEPYAVEPRRGQRLVDVDAAMTAVKDVWLESKFVEWTVDVTPPKVNSGEVHKVLDNTVRPLVSAPVTVRGDGGDAVLTPRTISRALRFAPEEGSLRMSVQRDPLRDAVRPGLVGTEKSPKDARIEFAGSSPNIVPSEEGRNINWERTFAPLLDVATKPADRELPVAYDVEKPALSTDAAKDLGIDEVIGEFSTSGVSGDAAKNVAAMARSVNGALVRQGETFSLDARTGPRTASQGYVRAPVHEDGTGRRVIGGGVSRFTSTLYNAAYLAGLKDAGHTAHRHYSDRFPPARDAVSLRDDGSGVDLAFTNDLAKGVAIQTQVSGSTVTVRIWGTPQYRVESDTGERTDYRPAPLTRDEGPRCRPSAGSPGFTVSDTRTLYDRSGREVRSETSTVTYEPRPAVLCVPGRPGDLR